jgi:threonine dehydratase
MRSIVDESGPTDVRTGAVRSLLEGIEAQVPAGDLARMDPFRAACELSGQVVRTVVRRLTWLERWVGVPVWAKLEFQQHTGSFKYRGAHLAVSRGNGHPVIAASAGNHGLAVAEAARRTGVRANICIPLAASRLKRERILATGAGLIEHGNSLEEATDHARKVAARDDSYYISPYNNPDMIAGAATLAVEFLDEIPDLTTAVVPIGGGGLASGFAVGARAAGHSLELIGCEPHHYASVASSLTAGEIVRVVHQPTLADGLAVNLEPGSVTFELARRSLSHVIRLTEEELAAATLALLVHESVLVEPSGAASLIACLRLAQQGRLNGPVAIPLCGGNLHHATLTKIQRYPFTDPDLLRLLDLRGRAVSHTPVARVHRTVGRSTHQQETASPRNDLAQQLDTCLARLDQALREADEYTAYCELHSLAMDATVVGELADAAKSARRRVEVQGERLREDQGTEVSPALLALSEATVRFGLSTAAHVRSALEWCAPSYAQSGVAQFFNTGVQDAPTVNYDRYESADTRGVETQLLGALGLPGDEYAVTATSSGMAAYTLVESFLLRSRLKPGDTVLTAPYIYFEAWEQLQSLPFVDCVRANGYETDDILAAVREHQPRCVFIDPVANTAQQRMADIPNILSRLRETVAARTTVVIDGTMVSGAFDAETLRSDDRVEVIYYESCSKYLQLGHDAAMAGMVAYPVAENPMFERLRRNTGTILYARNARLFPSLDREMLLRRMSRICSNALAVATALAADPGVSALGETFYPGSPDHADFAKARGLRHAGGCVTFLYFEEGRNHRDQLDAVVEHALAKAKEKGLHMTKGVSFGFSAPRISAAASMAETEPPFLRIYVGDLGAAQSSLLAEVIADAIAAV